MCDGDKSLVLYDKTLIEVAERNMEGVIPLQYNLRKAPSQIISNTDMYNGMNAAWSGGNIGVISNDITKIWNSKVVDESAVNSVKRLCCTNNQVID